MEEMQNIIDKYKKINLSEELYSLDRMKNFSVIFYGDIAEIYDSITRIKNIKRNPSGYNFNDAAISEFFFDFFSKMRRSCIQLPAECLIFALLPLSYTRNNTPISPFSQVL
ncbi:MAG: hypothetical protein V1933_00210, partial [Candidatus Omnitrophota bacterium]